MSALGVSENALLACGAGAVLGSWVGFLSAPRLRKRLVYLTAALPSLVLLLLLVLSSVVGKLPTAVPASLVVLALLFLLGGTISMSFLAADACEAARFPEEAA